MTLLITDPVDVLLGPDNDVVVVDGDIVLVAGVAGVAQLIRIAILMFAGEWFLNLDAGIKYLANAHVDAKDAILGEKFSPTKARKEFRDAILGVPGVRSLDQLDVSFDARTRTLSVRWVATTIFGGTVEDSLAHAGTTIGVTS